MTNPMEMIDGEMVEMSDADYAAFQAMQTAATTQSAITQLKSQAQAALDKSDIVATRCFKAGISFPSEWQAYVVSLRIIIDSGNGVMPTKPPYPMGT